MKSLSLTNSVSKLLPGIVPSKMKHKIFFLIALWITSFYAKAQISDTLPKSQLVLNLTLFDFPYQFDAAKTVNNGNITVGSFFKGYANPSMHQSLDLSADLYTGVHFGINKLFNANTQAKRRDWGFGKRLLFGITLVGVDAILISAPGFDGWEHEEFHRAVLSRYHVNSFNDMNKFPIMAEMVNVSHVDDNDLIRMKQESPHDFIRAHEAGIEGEYKLIDRLERNNFFYNQHLPNEFLYLQSTFNSIFYLNTCVDPVEADKVTDSSNAKETTIPVRDYTGLDFTAWAYDLFRPNEPYTARGVHPSGVGLDRYIKTKDLTREEFQYLEKQAKLHWLNILSPMLIGFKSIKLSGNGLYGNLAIRHLLTSFGNDISLNVYLMNPRYKAVFVYHGYHNYYKSFPGIEAQLIDLKTSIRNTQFYVSPRLLLGTQPLNQSFTTRSMTFLGLAECRVELKTNTSIHPFFELSAKSKGWVAGNEFLNSNFSCRLGITSRFKMK